MTLSLKQHLRKNLSLAFPVMIGQVGHIMVMVADTMMVGRVGVIPLAAATFASTIFNVLMIFGVGVSFAITPLVAASDPKDQSRLMRYLQNGIVLNMLLAVLLVLVGLVAAQFLGFFGQETEVAIMAKPYLLVISISLLPLMYFQSYRQYAEGLSDTFNPMWVSVFSNALNVLLNYLLIYGALGFPEMGLLGAGYATLIARVVMAILMHWSIRTKLYGFSWEITLDVMKRMLRIGVPSGMQFVFEIGAFAMAAVMVGWISAEAQAAHQIAVSMAALTYMAASGLGTAGTIRVGNQVGLKNIQNLKLAGYSVMLSVILFMACTGVIFVIFRHSLVSLFIEDATVKTLAASLLIIAAAFQISDGMQAAGLGVLRGLTDVKIPTIVTFISYWMVAMPLGYILGFIFDLGVYGVWYGLLSGLTLAAIMHFLRFRKLTNRLKF